MKTKVTIFSIVLVLLIFVAIPLAVSANPPMAKELPPQAREQMRPRMFRNFVGHLSGRLWRSRVNPNTTYIIATRAQGEVIFHLSKDGESLEFMLIVADIQNITMAHIHLDDGSKLGPIVVWLYPRAPPLKEIPGRFNGILAKGTITAANLIGLLEGKPLSMLMEKIGEGNAYVVVHTSQHPPGEIRGWVPMKMPTMPDASV